MPSSAPYNVTAFSSESAVHLTWAMGRQRSNVDFNIWYKPVDVTEWKTYLVPPTNTLEATITNLKPGN